MTIVLRLKLYKIFLYTAEWHENTYDMRVRYYENVPVFENLIEVDINI